jgi:DDE superfamily endonuclease
MDLLPTIFSPLMLAFQGLFSQRVWQSVLVLMVGGILAPGKRTVSAILQVMGLEQEPHFQTDHRVLNRAKWSSLAASRILLGQLLRVLVPTGPVVLGIDDTIERRKGKQIKAKGIYRDAVRSSTPINYGPRSRFNFGPPPGIKNLSPPLPTPLSGSICGMPNFLTRRGGNRHN